MDSWDRLNIARVNETGRINYSIYPRGEGRRENVHNEMIFGKFNAWGILNGPFADYWANLVPSFIYSLGFSSSSSSGRTDNNDILPPIKWDSVISVLGAFKWDHFLPVRHILFQTQSSSSSWTFMLELPFHINLERSKTLSSFWPKMSLYTVISYPNVVNLR